MNPKKALEAIVAALSEGRRDDAAAGAEALSAALRGSQDRLEGIAASALVAGDYGSALRAMDAINRREGERQANAATQGIKIEPVKPGLQGIAESSTIHATELRNRASVLLIAAARVDSPREAKDLETRAIALSRAASASSAVAVAAARAMADAVIGRLAADAEARRVDPVELAQRLRAIQGAPQGVQ